ncbi:MAG: nuclear transport factor 2 family protein [Cellulophaga sp.]
MRNLKIYLIVCLAITVGCSSCSKDDDTPEKQSPDILNDTFLESQAEIKQTVIDLFTSVQKLDADALISYHIYTPEFTHFKNESLRGYSTENEKGEHDFMALISEFEYDLNDLKINVFGDVAISTFHADFRPTINGNVFQIIEQATVVWIKVDGAWKITHEHFPP